MNLKQSVCPDLSLEREGGRERGGEGEREGERGREKEGGGRRNRKKTKIERERGREERRKRKKITEISKQYTYIYNVHVFLTKLCF